MGNFSINHYMCFEGKNDGLKLRYILDFAEIPTVTERSAMDLDGNNVISPAESKPVSQCKGDAGFAMGWP